ncbi:hypothetical protein HCN44_008056 [Aphidius gifuensis]|uniref:Uncharacterized protein n=1 Tax=Aphidius gifuensis TaxID=684658 RepID=A0A834XM29_APHGI|nr:hypothetical protein HCN44_008056 [Aphidius gifuensis]
MAADGKSQKYSIVPSKIISSSVFLSDGLIEMKTRDDSLTLENDNTRNLILNEELDANLEEPFPRGEPVPIKIGGVDGLLDNGKLTLKTEDGDTTFTFHHTLSLEVEKTSTTLQNEVKEKQQPGITLKKNGRFNYIYSGSKTTLKTPTSEKESTAIKVDYQLKPDDNVGLKTLLDKDSTPLIGNFSVLSDATIKIQANKSDEVYYFKHSVNIECDKKLDGNLDNKIVAGKENPKNKIIPEEVILDSGTVVFQTQDGKRL